MNARDILIYLHIKMEGVWEIIYNIILKKVYVDKEEVLNFKDKNKDIWDKYITIVDDDYPEELKHQDRPPFVIERSSIKGDK